MNFSQSDAPGSWGWKWGHLSKAQSDHSFPKYCSTICSNLETPQPTEPLDNTIPLGGWKAHKPTHFLLHVLRLLTQDYLGVLLQDSIFFPRLTHLATESLLQNCTQLQQGLARGPFPRGARTKNKAARKPKHLLFGMLGQEALGLTASGRSIQVRLSWYPRVRIGPFLI